MFVFLVKKSKQKLLSHTDGRCVYLVERNLVLCPMGKVLYPRSYDKTIKDGVFYNSAACKNCVCRCTKAKFK
jgi:hypothetical protein